jgi:hypothetical protein
MVAGSQNGSVPTPEYATGSARGSAERDERTAMERGMGVAGTLRAFFALVGCAPPSRRQKVVTPGDQSA